MFFHLSTLHVTQRFSIHCFRGHPDGLLLIISNIHVIHLKQVPIPPQVSLAYLVHYFDNIKFFLDTYHHSSICLLRSLLPFYQLININLKTTITTISSLCYIIVKSINLYSLVSNTRGTFHQILNSLSANCKQAASLSTFKQYIFKHF